MSKLINETGMRLGPPRIALLTNLLLPLAFVAVTITGVSQASNTRASEASSSIDLQVLATSIASDSSGNIYYADTAHSNLYKVSNTGTQTQIQCCTGIAGGLNKPRGVALDSRGDLYVVDTGNNQIVEIAPSSKASVVNTGSYNLSRPSGVALDANGDLYIADSGNNRIVEVAATGGQVSSVNTGSYTLSNPSSVSVGSNNTLFIADTGNNRIVAVPPSGSAGVLFSNQLHGPLSMTTDLSGNAYIAQSTTSTPSQVGSSSNGEMPAVVSSLSAMNLNVKAGGGSQGAIASANVTLTPMGGFNGTVYLSVVGLPPNVVLQLAHPIVSFQGNAPVSDLLQVGATTATQQGRVIINSTHPNGLQARRFDMALAGLLPFSVLMLAGFRASSQKVASACKSLGIVMLLLLLPTLVVTTSGCAGGYPAGLFGKSTYTAVLIGRQANGQPYSLGSFGITLLE